MIAPTSHERINMIASQAHGFLYCVSSLGVTGVRSKITTNIGEMVAQVKKVSDIPCAIGFGISTPTQAREMAAVSDGAIVGSAIVKIVAKYGKDCIQPVYDYVKEMKEAVNSIE
jgi:tryptophan synthase alpha chain